MCVTEALRCALSCFFPLLLDQISRLRSAPASGRTGAQLLPSRPSSAVLLLWTATWTATWIACRLGTDGRPVIKLHLRARPLALSSLKPQKENLSQSNNGRPSPSSSSATFPLSLPSGPLGAWLGADSTAAAGARGGPGAKEPARVGSSCLLGSCFCVRLCDCAIMRLLIATKTCVGLATDAARTGLRQETTSPAAGTSRSAVCGPRPD